jgi:hypothetical protein
MSFFLNILCKFHEFWKKSVIAPPPRDYNERISGNTLFGPFYFFWSGLDRSKSENGPKMDPFFFWTGPLFFVGSVDGLPTLVKI